MIDHDTVGVSNLHRQVLHATERVGMNKAASAALAIKRCVPSKADMSLQLVSILTFES